MEFTISEVLQSIVFKVGSNTIKIPASDLGTIVWYFSTIQNNNKKTLDFYTSESKRVYKKMIILK